MSMQVTSDTAPYDERTQQLAPAQAPPAPPPPAPPSRRGGGTGRAAAVAALVAALVAVLVAAPVAFLAGRSSAGDAAAPTPSAEVANVVSPAEEGTVAAVADVLTPSVVNIDVAGQLGQGSGSGVILRADGHILTNAHVVNGAAEIMVTLPDGNRLDADIVGADASSDLAVIKVDPEGGELPVPEFSTATPTVGELAVAIGSPFGLEGSVTSGIVSALNRSLPGGQAPLVGMIQTDAAINPGNSGGALADGEGAVIGINTAIISPSQSNDGVGFAIPMSTALPVAEELIEQGFVNHAQLGVQGQNIDPRVAELYGLGVAEGAVIVEVAPGSAAEAAGLERGDLVTAVDGEPIASMAELAGRIRSYTPGDNIALTIVRQGQEQTLTATLDAAPSDQQQ